MIIPTEAESGGKDARGVETEILFSEGQKVIEQGMVLLLPGLAIRAGGDKNGRLPFLLCNRFEAVHFVVDHILIAGANPVGNVEQAIRLVFFVVGGNIEIINPILVGTVDGSLACF